MSCATKQDRSAVAELKLLVEVGHLELGKRLFRVSARIKRQRGLMAAEAVPVRKLSVFLLKAGAVEQDQLRNVFRRSRRIDWACEAVLHEPRQVTAMIQVRMGHDYRIDRRGLDWKGLPVELAKLTQTLEHAAVDEHSFAGPIDQMP